MKPHLLKTRDRQFCDVWSGNKTFEVRLNDRSFQVGDILFLGERSEHVEWDYGRQRKTDKWYWTGRVITARVVHILEGGQYGIEDGYCVMSIDLLVRTDYRGQEV